MQHIFHPVQALTLCTSHSFECAIRSQHLADMMQLKSLLLMAAPYPTTQPVCHRVRLPYFHAPPSDSKTYFSGRRICCLCPGNFPASPLKPYISPLRACTQYVWYRRLLDLPCDRDGHHRRWLNLPSNRHLRHRRLLALEKKCDPLCSPQGSGAWTHTSCCIEHSDSCRAHLCSAVRPCTVTAAAPASASSATVCSRDPSSA